MSDSLRPCETVAHQAPPSMGFSGHEYWSGLPFPSPGELLDPGIKPRSPTLHADTLPSEPPGQAGGLPKHRTSVLLETSAFFPHLCPVCRVRWQKGKARLTSPGNVFKRVLGGCFPRRWPHNALEGCQRPTFLAHLSALLSPLPILV